MIELRDKLTNEPLGTISDEELRFLVDELEEESTTDRDYYISSDTIDMLEADGAPASLLTLLKRILGSEEGVVVRWVRTCGDHADETPLCPQSAPVDDLDRRNRPDQEPDGPLARDGDRVERRSSLFTQGRQDGRPGGRSDAARHVHHASAIPGRLPGVSALAHADRARDDRGRHAPPGDGGAVRSCVYANLGHRLVRLLARGDEAFRLGRGRDDSPAARSGALDHHLRHRNRRPADSAPVTNPTFVATANLRIGPH